MSQRIDVFHDRSPCVVSKCASYLTKIIFVNDSFRFVLANKSNLILMSADKINIHETNVGYIMLWLS